MPCDTRLRRGQKLSERKAEVRSTVEKLDRAILRRQIKPVVGPQGAITFAGWTERNDVTDACAYRQIMATGSALAKAEIARAEQIAGRSVDRKVLLQGHHGHSDNHGGITWHDRKG